MVFSVKEATIHSILITSPQLENQMTLELGLGSRWQLLDMMSWEEERQKPWEGKVWRECRLSIVPRNNSTCGKLVKTCPLERSVPEWQPNLTSCGVFGRTWACKRIRK